MQPVEGLGTACCVDEDIPVVEFVQEVVAHLWGTSGNCKLTDAAAVREALSFNFPCGDSSAGS